MWVDGLSEVLFGACCCLHFVPFSMTSDPRVESVSRAERTPEGQGSSVQGGRPGWQIGRERGALAKFGDVDTAVP